eukprot:scaffold30826_cov18-Tisochrysis_lutea.AAC.1
MRPDFKVKEKRGHGATAKLIHRTLCAVLIFHCLMQFAIDRDWHADWQAKQKSLTAMQKSITLSRVDGGPEEAKL